MSSESQRSKASARNYAHLRMMFPIITSMLLMLFMHMRCLTALSVSSDFQAKNHPHLLMQRRALLQKVIAGTCAATGAAMILPTSVLPVFAEETEKSSSSSSSEVKVFQTPSGLRYIDLEPGNAASFSPQYGQLVSIAYKAFITLPGGTPQQFDEVNGYLLKHGNGRSIAGLDEGLHTMKVGGKRRLLIPPKLGYVQSGLGPIPEYPWGRWKLNNLLDEMVEVKGGTVVMEVTLLSVIDDEADQGYYSDSSLSPEEFETLKRNLERKAAATNTV